MPELKWNASDSFMRGPGGHAVKTGFHLKLESTGYYESEELPKSDSIRSRDDSFNSV
jgi:hypothetical protein